MPTYVARVRIRHHHHLPAFAVVILLARGRDAWAFYSSGERLDCGGKAAAVEMLNHFDDIAAARSATDVELFPDTDRESITPAAYRTRAARLGFAVQLDAAPRDLVLDPDGARPVD
jgi:hypothetical protein